MSDPKHGSRCFVLLASLVSSVASAVPVTQAPHRPIAAISGGFVGVGLDQAEFAGYVRYREKPLAACFVRAVNGAVKGAGYPGDGRITISGKVEPDATLSWSIVESDFRNSRLESCVLQELSAWPQYGPVGSAIKLRIAFLEEPALHALEGCRHASKTAELVRCLPFHEAPPAEL